MQTNKETLPGSTIVFTAPQHRIGTDALLLADFCDVKRNWAVCDLGTGCGIVLLSLLDKGLQGPATGVEINPDAAALLQMAVEANEFSNVSVVTGDLRNYKAPRLFDAVVSNPPYFSEGFISPQSHRALARHQVGCSIQEICTAAAQMLKDGGRFCLCFPPARLAELISALRENKLEPKRLQFCRKAPDAAPWLVLVDARKAGGIGLAVLPDFILPASESLHY